jgi:hypothetical protein
MIRNPAEMPCKKFTINFNCPRINLLSGCFSTNFFTAIFIISHFLRAMVVNSLLLGDCTLPAQLPVPHLVREFYTNQSISFIRT